MTPGRTKTVSKKFRGGTVTLRCRWPRTSPGCSSASSFGSLWKRRYHEGEPLDDEQGLALSEAALARWAGDCYRQAADRVDIILGWVHDSNVEVAAKACALLAWFPPTPATVAALLAVPGEQARLAARASANLTLAHLPRHDQDVDDRLQGRPAIGPTHRPQLPPHLLR